MERRGYKGRLRVGLPIATYLIPLHLTQQRKVLTLKHTVNELEVGI